jgi:hypothetical protein
MALGTVFTTLHFLLNLQMGPISWSVNYTKLKVLVRNKHSTLFGPLLSYEENEVL